jgi:hypothetical protein
VATILYHKNEKYTLVIDMKHQLINISIVILLLSVAACKKKSTVVNDGTEIITTVELTFKDSANTAATSLIYVWEDIDGIGGNRPNQQDSIILDSAKTYFMDIRLIDKSKNPEVIVSDAIKSAGADHQFYVNLAANFGIKIFVADFDTINLPIGFNQKWQMKGRKQKGLILNLVLKHKPGKKTAGDGATIGDTDLDVTFPGRVQ